jgi:sugar lactone lactonase YvrE
MMRILCATVSLFMFVGSAVSAQSVSETWRTEGLSNPESVVFDPAENVLYVSNVAGEAMAKDGKGFISRLSPDGKIVTLEWAAGLDAPKGLALAGDRLYVSDIDQLVAVDTKTGAIAGRWPAAGAKFLNDVAADDAGRIFVSDMMTNRIWVLDGDRFEVWLEDPALENPNGLKISGDQLIVASWGAMEPDFSTKIPGHLLAVDLASKKITALGDPKPIGNLDGLEPDGAGGWYFTDWMSGGLFQAGADGKATELLDLAMGSADIGIIPAEKLLLVPMMNDGHLVAYKIQ